ncbi:hypothetical protein DFH08DRAFT_801572 [Mycena albidolilacea]|uniref:Uncharacterized protein n=1 Tax=Mycena albidolilacea TaxID=1033008 RepID=A0AAD7AIV2_9AGAR|nr:hypothetical protein DFH08DRAFT_801572 [Mycena albidolilacea]
MSLAAQYQCAKVSTFKSTGQLRSTQPHLEERGNSEQSSPIHHTENHHIRVPSHLSDVTMKEIHTNFGYDREQWSPLRSLTPGPSQPCPQPRRVCFSSSSSPDNSDLVECNNDQDLDNTEEQVEDDKGGKGKKHAKSNQKKGGWTIRLEEGGWTIEPEGQRRKDLGPNEGLDWRSQRSGLEGPDLEAGDIWNIIWKAMDEEDDRQMTTGGEATTNKRKKLKPEEKGRRELARKGIKPLK